MYSNDDARHDDGGLPSNTLDTQPTAPRLNLGVTSGQRTANSIPNTRPPSNGTRPPGAATRGRTA